VVLGGWKKKSGFKLSGHDGDKGYGGRISWTSLIDGSKRKKVQEAYLGEKPKDGFNKKKNKNLKAQEHTESWTLGNQGHSSRSEDQETLDYGLARERKRYGPSVSGGQGQNQREGGREEDIYSRRKNENIWTS